MEEQEPASAKGVGKTEAIALLVKEMLHDNVATRNDIAACMSKERRILSTVFTVLRVAGFLNEIDELMTWRPSRSTRRSTVKNVLCYDKRLEKLANGDISEIMRELPILDALREGYADILQQMALEEGLTDPRIWRFTAEHEMALRFPPTNSKMTPLTALGVLGKMDLTPTAKSQLTLLRTNLGLLMAPLRVPRRGDMFAGEAVMCSTTPSALGQFKQFYDFLGPRLGDMPLLADTDPRWVEWARRMPVAPKPSPKTPKKSRQTKPLEPQPPPQRPRRGTSALTVPPPMPTEWRPTGDSLRTPSPISPDTTPDTVDAIIKLTPIDSSDPFACLLHRRDFVKSANGPHILATELYHRIMHAEHSSLRHEADDPELLNVLDLAGPLLSDRDREVK
ncbi:hypothetical protein J8273_6168 [Carpediemonas membranifera]|uniref:Uncharacterized protein n=1 Tax=Carpediemonas membranifera TaxID=201153 RepID=A0A8J6AQR8_9EUKA|nr:hypothetical protein J8273_6168 [Carpediemonas membranifera]|eukprot:KAG9391408.1 hypothetical protein J8273_6168 [Carpediemonas membranifera]